MRSTERAALLIVALAMAILTAACGVAPGPTPTVPPATPSRTPAASRSLAPTPVPTPTPPPAGLADWQQLPAQESLRDAHFNSVAWVGDRFLGLGCVGNQEGCLQPAVWESRDGLSWRTAGPVFLPPDASSGTVSAAASSSRIGTVAAGSVRQGEKIQASIWLRGADGWVQVTPQSASDATVAALLASNGRVLAVGSGAFLELAGFKAWWSGDGTTWEAAPSINAEGYPTSLLPLQSEVLAWGPSCGVCVAKTAWWLTIDGTAWQPVDPPPGLDGAYITAIGRPGTQGGFEAFGALGGGDLPVRPAAWVADETATDWRPIEPPPQPDGASVSHVIPIGHGSVVAGTGPPGPGREQRTGLIWLRGPGETKWRPPMAIPDLETVALLQDPEQLNRAIVIGQTFDGLQGRLVIWTGTVEWAP